MRTQTVVRNGVFGGAHNRLVNPWFLADLKIRYPNIRTFAMVLLLALKELPCRPKIIHT